jgi:hypothetical protein
MHADVGANFALGRIVAVMMLPQQVGHGAEVDLALAGFQEVEADLLRSREPTPGTLLISS